MNVKSKFRGDGQSSRPGFAFTVICPSAYEAQALCRGSSLKAPSHRQPGCHRRHILEGTSFRLVKHPLLTVSESGTLS